MGVLSGLAEEMVDVLMDFGAIQDLKILEALRASRGH